VQALNPFFKVENIVIENGSERYIRSSRGCPHETTASSSFLLIRQMTSHLSETFQTTFSKRYSPHGHFTDRVKTVNVKIFWLK